MWPCTQPLNVMRPVFDEFLDRFPFCYGYWEKYAAAERRAGENGSDAAKASANAASTAVYERAVVAVRASSDMWYNYVQHVQATGGDVDSVCVRALDAVQHDPRACDIWRTLLKLRVASGNVASALKAFDQAVVLTTSYATEALSEYEQFAAKQPTNVLATPAERAAIESSIEGFSAKLTHEQDAAVRAAVVGARRAKYNAGQAERAARQPFEATLAQRWYFDVTEVDVAQQGTWRRYLDWATKSASVGVARSIFERCVIVCAPLPEFWLRFAKYERAKGTNANAVSVLTRAVKAVGKDHPRPAVMLSVAYERSGDFAAARKVHTELSAQLDKPLVEAVVNHANFERRQGNLDKAAAVLTAGLAGTTGEGHAFLAVQLARLHVAQGKFDEARATLEGSVEKGGSAPTLWAAYADVEAGDGATAGRSDRVLAVFRRALGLPTAAKGGESKVAVSPLKIEDQAELWERFVDFAEYNAATLAEVDAARAKYDTWRAGAGASVAHSTKRGLPGGAAGQGDAKRARAGVPAVPAAGAWGQGAGYPQPGYPQAGYPQPGYPQPGYPQAAYGAYGAAYGAQAYAGYAGQQR